MHPAQMRHGTVDFATFKAAAIRLIQGHPAMAEDSTCVVAPDLNNWDWQNRYDDGLSVQDVYDEADRHFNMWGW